MRPLRILITNSRLTSRTGTEVYLRDLALALAQRGHAVSVFTLEAGPPAAELRAQGIPVVTDLAGVEAPPDIIHGQHHGPTMTALLHFRTTPATFVVHDAIGSGDEPPDFPRVGRYVAVDAACRARAAKVAPEVTVIPNSVDLKRFAPRERLPERAARALLFASPSSGREHLDPVRAACEQAGLALDVVGVNGAIAAPEDVLGQYDVIFAKGRCALEAMAVGAAVVLCASGGVGSLVTLERFDDLRRLNFGWQTLTVPLSVDALARELAAYDPDEALRVRDHTRAVAGLDAMVDAWLEVYRAVLAAHREADPAAERRAAAAYVLSQARIDARQAASVAELSALHRALLAVASSGAYRTVRALFRVPGLRWVLHALRKRVTTDSQ